MKNIIRTITFSTLFAAVLFSAASCLEKYPGSSIPEGEAMQTFADAEQHVVGIYASLKTGNLYSGLLTLLPDIQADLLHAVEGNSNTYGRFWQWDILPTDEYIEAVYGSLYTVIGNCNFYLDRVDAVRETIIDDAELDQLDIYTGEVYAIRALCYSELIKCFCKAYDPATAENELGVVLRTKYFEKEPVVRASLKASYAQVLSDLEKAESLLDEDEDVANNYYMSLAGAYALHARVALYMQNWDDAIKYSTLVLDSDKFVLSSVLLQGGTYNGSAYSEFDSLWSFDSGSEIIWRIGFTPTSYGGALGTVFLNFNRDYTYFYPDFVPSQWVLDLYPENDYRYSSYFADASVTGIPVGFDHGLSWPLLVKYYGNRSFVESSMLFHVCMPKPFRLAEQYLIRAEANCRAATPDFSAANADILELRAARMASAGSVSLSASNWQEIISEERVKELYMEGFRLQDLKRWGLGFERVNPNVAGIQQEGSDLKIAADDDLFVWPIPQNELDAPDSGILPNDSNN